MLMLLALLCFVGTAAGGGALAYFYYQLPPLKPLEESKPSIITTIYGDNKEIIGEFFVERRMLVGQSQIPDAIRQGIIAIEDNIFYHHWGIDLLGITRAFFKNLRAGHVVQGGSTITQQLAKVLFLTPEQKYIRKIKEILLALQIEHRYTKDEILTLYLNQIYFGEGAYGIESAARTYFDKSASDLTLAEAALLCGLPKAPNSYSPFKNPKKAVTRRNLVLLQMKKEGFITQEQYQAACQEKLTLALSEKKKFFAAYFLEEVRKYLDEHYGTKVLYREGLKVYTSLNSRLQRAAEAAVREGIEMLDKRIEYRPIADVAEQEKLFLRIKENEGERFDLHKGTISEIKGKTDRKSVV